MQFFHSTPIVYTSQNSAAVFFFFRHSFTVTDFLFAEAAPPFHPPQPPPTFEAPLAASETPA
jgi:hypothetical protein